MKLRKAICHFIAIFIWNKKRRRDFRKRFMAESLGNSTTFCEQELVKLNQNLSSCHVAIYELYLDLIQKRQRTLFENEPLDAIKALMQASDLSYIDVDRRHNYLNVLANRSEWTFKYKPGVRLPAADETTFHWGLFTNYLCKEAYLRNKNVIFIEDSFLRSINTFADKKASPRYQKGISFTLDDLTCHFDSFTPSRVEKILNNTNFIVTEEQRIRARRCIDKIIQSHLTKYNHQPIYEPQIGRKRAPKILVVDQSYGDRSITRSGASDETFKKMLNDAISENPDADIIVKTHPDTICGSGGYYTKIKPHGNVYTQTDAINPISLVKYCDKVYVCSTQLGFEALMCDKEVHVYGMPFYAGWGLTQDKQRCPRRTNKRTLEELFYIFYIVYTHYVNPDANAVCEIEDAIEYLLKLRDEYFKKYNIRCAL